MRRFAIALLLASCVKPMPAEPADPLDGLSARLTSGAGLRMQIGGAVDGRSAQVVFDVSSPLTTVTTGCFAEPPSSRGSVRFPHPGGRWLKLGEVKLERAKVGERRLGERMAGLWEDGARCEVVLGTDVLLPYALEVDPSRRELMVTRSRPRADYFASASEEQASADEVHVLELTREPTTDWPMLAVRLRQGEAVLTGPFILATAELHSSISDEAARENGFRSGAELIRALMRSGAPLPERLEFGGYGFDELELAPGFGFRFAAMRGDAAWRNRGALGLLGSDVWGRFHVTVDVGAGVLVLKRPKVVTSGKRQQCGGAQSEEACFGLHAFRDGEGITAVGAVWRDLPEGGRVYLEPLGDFGEWRTACRIGFSFGRVDRGVSTLHHFPWEGLEESMPQCAASLKQASGATLALFEEGQLGSCPGHCAFVHELTTNRVSCECQPQLGGAAGEAERKFLELYRQMLERHQLPRSPNPSEEKEPD